MNRGTTLGALRAGGLLSFGDGYRTKKSELATDGFRILRAGDVSGGLQADAEFVSSEYAGAIGEKVVRCGDVILTTKGTVGRTAFVQAAPGSPLVYSPQLCFFRSLDAQVRARFLYYWFSSPEFKHQASSLQSSTDMAPYISLSQLAGVAISLPNEREQQAIAEVLGALDDKIAANTQLVDTLHQLASALFQGLRAAPTEPRTYGDLAQIGGGGTPSTKEPTYWDGEVMWAAPSDITSLQSPYLDETPRRITATGLAASSSPLYPAGSILMTSRATIGAFAVNQVPTAVNQGFIVVQPHDPTHKWWLFHEMHSRVPEYINYANGATFLELPRSAFKKLQVRVPERAAVEQFDEKVSPLHALALSLVRESRTLAELRDTLLPRLMDGTMRVKDAEHSAGDVL